MFFFHRDSQYFIWSTSLQIHVSLRTLTVFLTWPLKGIDLTRGMANTAMESGLSLVKGSKWHLTLSQEGKCETSQREKKEGKCIPLLWSTQTEEREGRLIPVQSSLKTARITMVHSKHMGDKLGLNSHLSISHLTGPFTCYINHLRTQGEEARQDAYSVPPDTSNCSAQNNCARIIFCMSERAFQCKNLSNLDSDSPIRSYLFVSWEQNSCIPCNHSLFILLFLSVTWHYSWRCWSLTDAKSNSTT